MTFVPMKTRTQLIVEETAGFMEFDLQSDMGYGEWLGLFQENRRMSRLFNGYMVQNSVFQAQMSSSPVEIHLFSRGMFVAPPNEEQHFYFEIQRSFARMARVYFRIPHSLQQAELDGYKPPLDSLLAVDIWTETSEHQGQMIYSFFYEADIQTETRQYEIRRFTEQQLKQISEEHA